MFSKENRMFSEENRMSTKLEMFPSVQVVTPGHEPKLNPYSRPGLYIFDSVIEVLRATDTLARACGTTVSVDMNSTYPYQILYFCGEWPENDFIRTVIFTDRINQAESDYKELALGTAFAIKELQEENSTPIHLMIADNQQNTIKLIDEALGTIPNYWERLVSPQGNLRVPLTHISKPHRKSA